MRNCIVTKATLCFDRMPIDNCSKSFRDEFRCEWIYSVIQKLIHINTFVLVVFNRNFSQLSSLLRKLIERKSADLLQSQLLLWLKTILHALHYTTYKQIHGNWIDCLFVWVLLTIFRWNHISKWSCIQFCDSANETNYIECEINNKNRSLISQSINIHRNKKLARVPIRVSFFMKKTSAIKIFIDAKTWARIALPLDRITCWKSHSKQLASKNNGKN